MKKNTWKRHAALALVGAMAVGSLYGCGSKSASTDTTQTTAGETTGGASSDEKEKLVIALQTYSFITGREIRHRHRILSVIRRQLRGNHSAFLDGICRRRNARYHLYQRCFI